MNRREFLKTAATLGLFTVIPLGTGGWAVGGPGPARKRLIVLFLRGAVDGLSVVVPHFESAYYDARPTIAIPRPGGTDGVLDLDGRFGLHPALEAVMPLWQQGSLAFVHACGSPDATRSHFDAQDYMESGTPGDKNTPGGWLNRLLAVLPGTHTPTQGVSVGETIPRIFSGPIPVANLSLGKDAARKLPLDRPAIKEAFARMYQGTDPLSVAYQKGSAQREELLKQLDALDEEQKIADHGAPSPLGFSLEAQKLAGLIQRDPSIQLAFMDLGGWDTHVNQGAVHGQLAGHLRPLADGLSTLVKGLGDTYQDTTILVMSEFGRTFRENGNAGTDHGHGNVMWALGGRVQGKRIYGDWPGLTDSRLYQGRDLAITMDFRQVLTEVLAEHLALNEQQLATVLPGAPGRSPLLQGLAKA
ncbi:MAG TPA: DUF1501 domain-containing protein [Oscillatoriaceae cyanobacterium]